MSKALIARVIQDAAGDMTAVRAANTTNTLLEAIIRDMKRKGKFTLPGFGTFSVKKTKARMALNPRDLTQVKVKAGKTVRFKASPKLKKLV